MGIRFKLTVVCDNVVRRPALLGEHGLAFFVEAEGPFGVRRLLFDTGQGLTLLHNARCLGVPLARLDAVVLSHGHYDHTGGVPELLRLGAQAPVYCHPKAFLRKVQQEEGRLRETGVPWRAEELADTGLKFVPVTSPCEVLPGFLLTGEIPRVSRQPPFPGALVEENGLLREDAFTDEVALVLVGEEEAAVLVGCGHAGLGNMLAAARTVAGGRRVIGLAGGFHLAGAKPEVVKEAAETVVRFGVREVLACHCSGPSFGFFLAEAGLRYHPGEVGFVWEF